MTKGRKFGWILASVTLYNLAFPPFNLGWLVFVALVPWLIVLKECTPREAWRWSLLWGALWWWAQMNWLLPFVGKWTGSYLLAAVPLLLVPLVVGWFFGVVGVGMQRLLAQGRIWAIPLLWGGIEWLRSEIPILGFPWGQLATPLWTTPWVIQLAAFGQIFLVSAWVATANVVAYEAFFGEGRRRLTPLLAALAVGFAASIARYNAPIVGDRTVVSIGQLGVDMAFGDPGTLRAQAENSSQEILTVAGIQQSQLLILPEAVTESVAPLAEPIPVPVLYGVARRTPQGSFQSTAYDDGSGPRFVDKTRLVIFGEYVPFRDALPFLDSFNLPSGDLRAGDKVESLETAIGKVGPLICFEGLFSSVAHAHAAQGSRLLAYQAIDDWYTGTSAIEQLRIAAIWRAVENQLPVARSASRGYSLAVDTRGNVMTQLPFGPQRAARVEFALPRTADALPGRNWCGPLLLAAGVLALFAIKKKGESAE